MPVGRLIQRAVFLAILWITAAGVYAPAQAEPIQSARDASEATSADQQLAAVQTGEALERSRHWLEAIEHYEAALKRYPENKGLKYGLRRSKAHFSIERRYSDGSFETMLLRLPRYEALQIFDEVYSAVRAHYVDEVSPTSFVAHGTESLYLALANEKFVGRHLSGVDSQRIAHMRTILRDEYWNLPVSSAAAARQTVSGICDLAEREVGLSDSAVVMEYIFGGCNALDDYSSFLSPDRREDLFSSIEGEFVGLGIEMKAEQGKGLLLVNVLPGSPAAEGGMRRGDYITRIDGTDCLSMTTDEAARLLRGMAGSTVQLTLRSRTDGSLRDGRFVRRAVVVKSIPVAKIIDRQNGIGYIQMTGFQKSTPDELRAALASLHRQGMRSLIWDLRGNPGGLLNVAVDVLDEFIDEGVLVSIRGRTPDKNITYTAHRIGTDHLPLVLLVDGDSASASEIVAGAIHDYKRGTIVGRNTFGKWSVQDILTVRGSTGLRLTTAKFYSPRGRTLGKIGIRPDVVVDVPSDSHTVLKPSFDENDLAADPDLRKGIDILRGQVTQR